MKRKSLTWLVLVVLCGIGSNGFPQAPDSFPLELNTIESNELNDPNVNHYSFGKDNRTTSDEVNKTSSPAPNFNNTETSIPSADTINIDSILAKPSVDINKTISDIANVGNVTNAEVDTNVDSENVHVVNGNDDLQSSETSNLSEQLTDDSNKNPSSESDDITPPLYIPPNIPSNNDPGSTPGSGFNLFGMTTGFFESARGVVSNAAGTVVQGAVGITSTARDYASTAVNTARGAAGQAVGAVTGAFNTARNMAGQTLESAAGLAANAARTSSEMTSSAFNAATNNAKNLAGSIVGGVINLNQ